MFGFHHHHRHGSGRGRGGPFGGSFGGWSLDGEEGRRGGRRRQFDSDGLRLILLALIAEQPRHGYDLIREIEARSGGAYGPSPGVVYPTLTLLDEMGLVEEVREEGARRRFAITGAGRGHLEEKRAEVDALLARLAALAEDRARTDRAPVRRAMVNLGLALRAKMAEAAEGPDRAHEVAAILDEAARQVERL